MIRFKQADERYARGQYPGQVKRNCPEASERVHDVQQSWNQERRRPIRATGRRPSLKGPEVGTHRGWGLVTGWQVETHIRVTLRTT